MQAEGKMGIVSQFGKCGAVKAVVVAMLLHTGASSLEGTVQKFACIILRFVSHSGKRSVLARCIYFLHLINSVSSELIIRCHIQSSVRMAN